MISGIDEETYNHARDVSVELVNSLVGRFPKGIDPLEFSAAIMGMLLGSGVTPAVTGRGPEAADRWIEIVGNVANHALGPKGMQIDMRFVRKES